MARGTSHAVSFVYNSEIWNKPEICIRNAYFDRRADENIVSQCFVRVNPDNENHQQGFYLLTCKSLIFIRQL
jgi:hypothetical protein